MGQSLLTSVTVLSKLESEWYDTNPVIALKYAAFSTDTGTLKIGNGIKHWRDLPIDLLHQAAPNHAATHATGQRDALTPSSIGAAAVIIHTTAEWEALNPVCPAGALMLEGDGSESYLLKISDGITHWQDLEYFSSSTNLTAPSVGTLLVGEQSITLPFEYDVTLKNIWVFLSGVKQDINDLNYPDSTHVTTKVPMEKDTKYEVYLATSAQKTTPDWVIPVSNIETRLTTVEALAAVDDTLVIKNSTDTVEPEDTDNFVILDSTDFKKMPYGNMKVNIYDFVTDVMKNELHEYTVSVSLGAGEVVNLSGIPFFENHSNTPMYKFRVDQMYALNTNPYSYKFMSADVATYVLVRSAALGSTTLTITNLLTQAITVYLTFRI